MREYGIDTPIVHNSANPGMNAHFCETEDALGRSFLLGTASFSALGYEHDDVTQPAVRLWNDVRHLETETPRGQKNAP